jgi:hypothetical protein
MSSSVESPSGPPEPQWSADGQWWWDGRAWTQMWHAPSGLAWSGDAWVRSTEDAPPPDLEGSQVLSMHPVSTPSPETPPEPAAAPVPAAAAVPAAAPVPASATVPASVPVPAPIRKRPAPASSALEALPQRDPGPPPRIPAAPATGTEPRSGRTNRITWLVAAATVLVLAGISSVFIAMALSRPTGNGSSQSGLHTGQPTSAQIAASLPGRKFTRDVVPPELADAAPLRDVFVLGSVPGLIGQASTTTSDLGGTVTFYVFADPVWAQAFFDSPPTAYGCGVCTSMDSETDVKGVGDRAKSYVLYRKTVNGKSWIATTTYVLRGSVVIDALYFPVSVSAASPSQTDVAVPALYAKAGIQLLDRT